MGEANYNSAYHCVTKETIDTQFVFDISGFVPANYLKEVTKKHVVIGSRVFRSTLKLNRYLYLNADICWAIGFFMAEGAKCNFMVSVSNCESQLVDKFRSTLEKYLFTTTPPWRYFVKTSDKKRSEEVWPKKYPGSKVIICECENANNDNLEIRFNNRPLAYTFNSLVEKIAQTAVSNPHFVSSFLKGYAIGDGSIIRRKGYLYGVAITVKNTRYKDLLLRAIKLAYGKNVPVRKTKGCHEISLAGIELMNKIILDGWFMEVPKQRQKLLNSFYLKEYTKSHVRYWKALQCRSLQVSELAMFASRSHWAVRDAMKRDAGFSLIEIKKKRITGLAGPHHVFFTLTDRGENLLNSLLEVKECEKT